MLEDLRATLEGPGSVPWKQGDCSGRGMFNRGHELQKLGKYAEVDGENCALFIAKDQLPGIIDDGEIQIGEPDIAAASAVTDESPRYFIVKRVPIDDGLMHMLVLEGGPDA